MSFKIFQSLESIHPKELLDSREVNFKKILSLVKQNEKYLHHFPELKTVYSIDDLSNLPILTAERLASLSPPNCFDLVCNSKSSGVVLSTGGTTGEKKTFYHTWESFRIVMKLGARSLRASTNELPSKVANCFAAGSLWGGHMFGQGVIENLQAQLFSFVRPSPSDFSKVIFDHKVDALFASPSFATSIICSPDSDYLKIQSIKQLFYLGERLSKDQKQLILNKIPTIKIKSLAYTTNEIGPIGYQCSYQTGNLHHIHEDCVHIELIDDNQNPITESSTIGEIIVSTLCSDGMPLFRYKVGDRAHFVNEICPCGSPTKIINLIGRSENSTNICGNVVSENAIMKTLESFVACSTSDIQCTITIANGKTDLAINLNENIFSNINLTDLMHALHQNSILKLILSENQFGKLTLACISPSKFTLSERTGKKIAFVERD